ncbi:MULTISPECIES: hypothetical protein [unclassified Arthrobacter]|uniref:hypothetical protein n=1 Tax=unclassified Arthrobacter TaxID=235627 RepID=UPI001F251D88|nr:hypothetical protein [Arthrobacter sp. FW305-BF8]UKA53685.1 hypothetical protein LFT45_18520 [Arthrobacter sp. FW305-BF8]
MLGTQAVAADPDWLRYAAAFAPLLAAVIAGWIAWRTLAQRREADRRDQWWKRTQWAIGLAMDRDFSRAIVGLVALKHLAASDLCTDEDYEMLDKIGGAKIDALTLSGESARREAAKPPPAEPQRPEPPPHHETAVPTGSGHRTVIPVTLESRGERVMVTSGGMAKVLTEADRLVSFVALQRSGRRGPESGGTANR